MNRFFVICVAVMLAAGTHRARGQQNTAAEKLFASAQHKATVDGDLRGAIEDYKKVVNLSGSNRQLAARALLRMAEAHETLGGSEARRLYQDIVTRYADQKDAVTAARARLARTGSPATAGATVKTVWQGDGRSVSADGRLIAFVNWETGNISVRDLQAGVDRPVTKRSDYAVYDPAISRDGRWVAYRSINTCADRRPYTPSPNVLCVVAVQAEGEPVRTLVDDPEITEIVPMDWAPDGRSIAVALRRLDRTTQVAIVNAVDGSYRVLESVDWRGPSRIYFSPDGRDIAFDLPVDASSDQRDIFVRAVDGSGGATVSQHASQDLVMGWSPDGAHLLFASDSGGTQGLWAQPFVNRRPEGAPRLLRANFGSSSSLGVTSGGALYSWMMSNESNDIEIASLAPVPGKVSDQPVRPFVRRGGRNLMPAWSPDGKQLAFVFERMFSPRRIGILTEATGDVREVRPELSYVTQLAWSPDGARLATAGTDLKGRSGVFVVDVRSGQTTLVVEDTINAYPRWSPDGRRLYYRKLNTAPTEWTIVERDLSSGAERTVASGELGIFSVSPDGEFLAAVSGGILGSAAKEIVLIRIRTGETRPLLRALPAERIPIYAGLPWTPDGSAVLVRKRTPNELWLAPVSGTARKLDVDLRRSAFGAVSPISLHPDGQRLAFVSEARSSGEVMVLDGFLPLARQ